MMDCAGGRDPVEDFLLGGAGAGDDGDLVAVFCDDGGLGIEGIHGDACGFEQSNLGKRGRDEPCSSGPTSKACREKMRRDKLNDRFLELSSIMNPGKEAKLDKANILSDAARMVAQLRGEAEKLKESNEKLRENIKDLKEEKNELREEKVRLKVEKDRLEQQVKAMSVAPTGYVPHLPHPASYHPAAFTPFASTWELADRQDLPTLLHLPIFCLAQSLALLSVHYPTHTLGSNIIERILSPNEPWLAMLHNYISNLGGAKFASSKQRDSRTSKGSDVAALASLILLREVSTFAKGRYAVKLFDSFNWSMKVLPHIFSMRRRTNRKSKAAKKPSIALDVSLRRPDIRTLYILFLLSFLQQSYSNTLKIRLLDLGRDFLPAMLKGLPQDPPDVVQTILLHLHEDLVKDQRIPRSKKVEFWNEWACGCVVQLYPREEEHVLIHADTDAVENPSVAELAHHFMLSICTNPGFGICYPDRGWYPRKASARGDADEAAGTGKADGAANGLDKDSFSFEMGSTQKAKPTSISTGGSIYNKVLSGVLRQLAVAEDLRQQELALSILTACPELVGPYLESSCAGLSVDPRPSSRWLCNVAFFGRVAGLELPSFRNAKVEHLESEDAGTSSAIVPLSHRLIASEPPPINTVLANLLPGPLHRFLFSQGLTSTDKLVRHSTCALLCRCLDRMVRYRDVCLGAIDELDEDEHGPWRRHLELLEMEARRRIPDISIVIQILQVATSRPQASAAADSSTAGDGLDDRAEGASENLNMLSTEVALRLLSLYYQAVPSSAFDVRFNAGKLLSNSFIQASAPSPGKTADDMDTEDVANEAEDAGASDSDAGDDEEDTNEIDLGALCQVHTLRILSHAARAASFDWTAKPTGTTGADNLSYLGMLLTLYISTPLEQVKTACEQLLRSLLAPSSFFEHVSAEIDAWLSSLPQADTRVASQADDESGCKPSVAPSQQQISSEQRAVIAFLDECLLRCAKTPYRYIEASRQFLRENGSKDAEDDESQATSGADLLASPWLMALLEQFCIRIDKGLFDDAESVEGFTAFFARLLPTLCAYARHTSTFEAMAFKINGHIAGNNKYASSQYTAAVCESNVRAIRIAPEPASESGSKSIRSIEIASTTFADCTDPRDLKTRLRSVKRPLTQSQISSLYTAVQGLQAGGYALASQILSELDPVAENVATALFGPKVLFGAIPVLHLPLNARFVPPAQDDFMATTSEEELLDQPTLVPWLAKSNARLALWTALSRGRGMQDERYLLPHASSLVAAADASEYLTHEEARQFLFVDSVALLNRTASPHVSKSLLRRISELAIKYLDPRHKDQAQIVRATLDKVDGRSKAVDVDYLRCMANLTPFMDEAGAVELLFKALEVLREAMRTQDSATEPAEAEVWIAAAELLAAIASSASPTSRVWTALAVKLQLIVDAVCSTEGLHAECRTLLLGIIQATLQSDLVLADSAVEKQLAMLQLGGLINGAAQSRATDGALVAALHVHPKTTLPMLESLLDVLSSGVSADARNTAQALPCTLLAILTALSEAGSATNDGGAMLGDVTWDQKHIGVIVDVCIDFVLADPEPSEESENETVERHAACLVAALKCAARYGWNEPQSAASGRLAKFAKDAVENKPYVAFRVPLIQVLLGLVEDVPELPSLSEVVQASINAALLWLVRRFAEDSNDSAHLVHIISLFADLVERASASDGVSIHLRASLVDPVVQAAIKNRMRALEQMRLVRALCVHAELDNTHLSRYLGALSAHSDFASVMRGSANLLAPLRDDTDEQENGLVEADSEEVAEDEKVQCAQELKLVVVELVHLIAGRDAKGLIRAPLLTKLLPFYGASLSRADRMLLSLFRKFEEVSEQSFATLMQEWTLPASQQGGSGGHAHSALEALQSLDANVVFATCTEFPRLLSLANTVASVYKTEAAEAGVVLPGQVYGRHTDAAQRYDPVFLASLLARVTAPDEKLTGLQWLAVFATNVPGLAVCGLSSCCPDMRRASLTLISSLYLAVREADFQERDHLIMVLDLLRDALDSTQAVQDSSADAPFLPTTTTLFIAHSLRSVTTPASFIYPVISHFLLQRSELDVGDVPLLYNLLYTASDRVKQERMWMLRLLRDVARSGGRSDWKILKRRRTWELLASLYDACDARGVGASADRAVEEAAMRALVEDTTFWLVANADVAIELVTRRGLLAWMWQQIVREGVVALADPALGERTEMAGVDSLPPASAPRSVCMLLLAQLMRSVDVDRLDRATQGAWIAPVLSLVHTTTAALHNCATAPAGGHLPKASDELVRTITCAAAEVIDRLVPHAQEHARLHATALLATLETLVKLGAKALHSAGKKRAHVERACVRVNSALLTIASALTDAASTRRMAVILRQSTALCMRFDAQIHALVTSNLFPPTFVS